MSYTVEIPGGTAELLEPEELTPRRQRAVQVIALQSGPLMKKMEAAGSMKLPDGTVKESKDATLDDLPEVELTEREATLFFKIQDATIYAHLQSWTLDIARPQTIDEVQDIPGPVYDALSEAINQREEAAKAESFEPNEVTLEEPASPFGSSSDSATSSTAVPQLG
ncbi:hypothetical protein SEA_SONALI_13 [Arthrobacter phage Sonali]|uniref:Uncharacterized protein n=1 Tax=Arthrobacter phage Sonali TaxID=2510495 RepID=A0A411CQP9_9CAUD|nr:hypothetical protein HOV09_gp13 [Arthrobacter phage Sonali]QAY16126.1 hypothetical protein SEA_SONALI_13 [Arthrobacter phage Sonali]